MYVHLIDDGAAKIGMLVLGNGTILLDGSAAPTDGTTGTGAGVAGIGSLYFRTTNGAIYTNSNTLASPTWTLIGDTIPSDSVTAAMLMDDVVTPAKLDASVLQYAEVTISAADLIATTAGKFGHADGYPLVAGAGAGTAIEFISATLIYDQGVKAYTGGGDTTVNWASGGAVLSNKIEKTEFCAHNGDTVNLVQALVPAIGISLPVNTGINLVTTVAFADGGVGAVGVVRAKVVYRVHATGL